MMCFYIKQASTNTCLHKIKAK